MPYIGNTPAEKYAAFNVQHFTTSATTSYTLTHAVANELDIRLVLNNVVQQPGASYAYTASATTLTLSVATTGTDTMYAVYIGKAVQTVTPGADSVGPTALQDNSVTEAKLNVSNSPTNGYVLSAQSGATGGLTWAADAAGTITAFTNGVDNRVVTATSATALNGEAGLIFDGSKLGIGTSTMTRTLNVTDTTASASTGIQLIGANDGTQFINFGDTDDTNVGEINYDHGLNKMKFRTNDVYALELTSSGAVLIKQGIYGISDENTGIQFDGSDVITFHTNGTERVKITSDGDMRSYGWVGGGTGDGWKLNRDANQGSMNIETHLTTGRNLFNFINGNGTVGTISTSGSATAFNTSSDYRLKENVNYDFDATTRLKQLKPARFNFKTDADTTVDGFIAHEVSGIVDEAIAGEKDAMFPEVLYTDEVLYTAEDELPEGKNIGDVKHSIGDVKELTKPNHQGIDQSKLVPLLTKALQEAITKIETLEAKVTALENA